MRKKNLSIYLLLFTSLLFFAAAFHKSFSSIFLSGFTWHHLIPLITGYLIWTDKKQYFSSQPKPNPLLGSAILTCAFLLEFTGTTSSTLIISQFSIVIGIWGMIIFIGGSTLFKRLMFPLVYLLFISPSIDALFDILTPVFRNTTAHLSTISANLLGYTPLLSNTYIRLPNMILNVADACSGINHLISLIAITIPLAILTQRKLLFSIILILFAVPVALFSNSLRVLVLIIYNYDRQIFAHGHNNILATEFGFYVGLFIIFISSMLLSKLSSVKTKLNIQKPSVSLQNSPLNMKTFIYLTMVLSVGAVFLNFWRPNGHTITRPSFNQFVPVSDYTIEPFTTIPEVDSLPIADQECKYRISNSVGDPLFVYIGWYERQTQKNEVAGYGYDRFLEYEQTYKHNGSHGISSFRICKSKQLQSNFRYWITYRSLHHYTTSPVMIKLFITFDALFRRSTSASVIILAIPEDQSLSIINRSDEKQIHLLDIALQSVENNLKH
jgi:exosortase